MSGQDEGFKAAIALGRLKQYASFAQLQFERVQAALSQSRARAHPDATDLLASPDIHLYFIVWDTVLGMINVVSSVTRFPTAGVVRRRHLKVLEHYRVARDDFEHFDERLPSSQSKKARPLLVGPEPGESHGVTISGEMSGQLEVWRSGVVRGTTYHFSGQEWDIGPSSLATLHGIVNEFITAVQEDAKRIANERRASTDEGAV